MDKEKVDFFKNKLINDQLSILEQLNALNKSSSSVDSDGDEADTIQANTIIELDSALANRLSIKLEKIKNALERIKNDEFGLCEDCEEEIPEKRLAFNACVSTCVKCQEQREFDERQRNIK